jgi:hypothetical protein
LALGCAHHERAPVIVVAAAPSVTAAPRHGDAPTAAPAPPSEAERTPIDAPHWRSTDPSAHADTTVPPNAHDNPMLDAADRLMGGDLTRAEQACTGKSDPEREACINAYLEKRMTELGGQLDREFRGLELLQREGEGRCAGNPSSDQHSECVLAEMERLVTELAPACASKSGQAQHQCIIDEVFRQLGP